MLRVARQAGYEFLHRVILAPVHEGRLRDVDWPLGLRPLVTVGLVGYVVAALLVLFSGPLREWVPLAAQSGTVLLTLPRALVWIVLALTALSTSLAASGALHARAWLRWVMTGFVVAIMLFISVPDQEDIPVARILTIVACIGLVVFVALRGGRGYRWWDFVVIVVLVWGPLIVTAAVLTSVNRAAGFDFVPLLLSLTLSTLGQLAVPAGLAAGAAVASVTVSSALWAAKVVRGVIGSTAVYIVLGLVAVWRTVDVVLGAGALFADAEAVRPLLGSALLLGLIAGAWVVLARLRPGRGEPTAQGMTDHIDALALVVAAFTTTTIFATPLIVLAQVALGYGAPAEVPTFLVWVAGAVTDTIPLFIVRGVGALVLIALAVVQARRGRRTLPELMAAVGIAGALISAAALFRFPLLWGGDALAILGAVLALGVLVVSLVRRALTPARATSVLIALLMSALFAYRDIVTDPIAFLLGFAGGAVVLFGFVWSFLTGYKAANEDSRAYPRPARVQLVLANAVFGITVLAFLALARDPDAAVSLGDLAEFGGQAYGDPLVASGLLLALWAAVRGRELDDVPEEPEGEGVTATLAESEDGSRDAHAVG
ncbi:hypothetical protein D7I47_04840 [Protaetiibacter intestinalis]|uniref:Uncharacterized protein n=1 Tax=Protaetiibacter intestinalis TaxID=2419774 RepID=A0A387B7A2_9MICO|nr:hypothetical protein D7I47_04840 [Protaetiibacter intestinalis]